ncbi:hypothetical protein NDU88_011354 [Pleurodeles waltl]|uniref:SPATA31 domain-containing protein n=1 Tax=Pleurodeles waltl TaxID=8319 RepID=A0AAV7S3Z6_PLEWA|nr:hypothetical protein NDU88_011354 [Pleurodeles waltl]
MKYMGGPLETDTCQLCGNAFCQECGLVLHSDGLPDGLDVESTRARRGSSRKVRQRSLTSSNRGSGKGVPKTSNPSSQSIHHSVSMSSSDESIYGSSLRSAYPRKRSILVDCRDRTCPRNCCCFGTSAWKRSCGMATSRLSDKPMRERRSRGRKRYQTDSLQVSRCPRSTTNQKRNSDTSYLSSSTSSSYRMIPSQQSLPTDASSRRLLLPGDTSGRLSSSSDDDLIQSCHSGHTTTYSGRSTPHSGTSLYSDISSMESARPLESKPADPISSLCNDEEFSPSGVSQTLPPYARKISFPQIVDIPDSEEDSSRVSHFSCLLQEAQSTRIAHLLRQRVLHPLYGFPEPVAKSQKWAEEKQKTNEKKISQCPGKFVPKIQINDNILTPPMKEDGEGLRSDPSMETSFLSDAIKERLELHLNNKALQNVCDLPTTVEKSQGMFMPLAPTPIKPTPCRKRVKTVLAALVTSEAQQLPEAHLQKKVQKHHSTLLGKISESAQEVLPSGSPRPDHESLKDTAEMNEGPPIKITTQKTDKMNKQQTETCVSTGMEQMPSQVKEFGQIHVFLANSHLPKCVFKGQGIKRPRVGNMPSLSHDVMRSLEQNLSRKHHVLFSGPSPHPTNSQPSLPVESGTSSIMLKKKEAGFVESKTGHSRELCGQKKLLLVKGTLPVKQKQSFSVASPPPPKMQQKQGVKTSLWPREQKNASSVPKTTSSTSSLGSKPRVANGGGKRRRRRRRRKCHPAVTKRSQQMLIKGLEPCLPKPLITVSKCLLPRPCPSQEKIRNVQTDGLEPCSPKPLITGSKCLLPRPCPSQENIRYVQTDGLEPPSPTPLKPTPCRKRVKIVLAALVSSEAQQLLEAHFQKKVQKHHSTLLGKISESAQEVLPSGSPRPDHESLKDTAEMNEGPPIKITTKKTDKMNNQQTETCVSTGMEQMPSQVKEFGQNHVFLANSHLTKCVFKGQGIKRPRVGNMPSLSHDVMRSLEQNLSRKHHVLFSGPSPHPTNSQPSLPVKSGTSSIMLKKKEAGFVESKTGHSRELCGQKKLLLAKGTLPVKRKQSFSVASPPPPKMQQKQGVKTSLWPREQKHASSVPKTTSSTSSLGSKPRVANGGSKRRRRRRRRRKCHPAVTKRSQQMLIKGLEPCSPKPLITGSKCLLPRPCPSQEKIRNVQMDDLEPCSPKPLITVSKCLLPRPCPSQEKIRNVQTDGLEPCSPKPLITGSKCLLARPCPSQEKIRNVQTDGLEPCSPKHLITGSKCLLPRPCPSQEKIRYVQTDGLEPRSPKPLITGSKCLLPRPCPSQEKIRYVQKDGLEPCSPKPLITGSKCLLPRPCPSQEKIRYVQTDGLEPCSLKPLITWSKCLLARPCPRQENIRHVQTDGLEPCLPKPLITGNKYLLPRPCPSQENIRYVQTDGLEPCSPKPLITGSKYLLPRPCPSQENIRYVQTDNKDTHAKLPSKPHMSYKQYYSKTAAKETQMFMESESGTTTRIVNCTCSPLVQPNAMQDLEPDNTRKTLIHEQRFTAKPEMPRGAFMPSVPLERPPAESSKKKENIHINLVDVTILNENCKHLLELHITRNITEENHECPSSISSKTVDKLMAHMPKVSATSQCQTQPTNRNLHTSVISIRSDIYQKDANQETRSLQYNVFVSHFHKNPYMVFQHRHQLLMKHTKSEFKVHTEGLLSMEKVLFPKQSHLGGRHLKSRTTFLPFAEHNIIDTVDWNLRHKLLRHLWGLAPLHHDDYKKSNTKDLLRPPPPAEVTANTELSEVESDFLMLTQRALLEQHIQMKTMHSGWGLPTLLQSSLQAVMASSPECSSIEACPQPEDEIVMIGEEAFFSPETTRKCVESHAKQRLMLQDFGLPNTAEESLAELFPPSTCNEALASQKEATVDVPRLPASPGSTKESKANDSALLVATSKKQKGMPYKIPKDAPVQIKPPMSKKKSVQKKRGLPQKIVDFFKALIVCKLPRSEETVDCYRISSVLGCPSFSVQIGKGHIELFNSSKELTIYSSDLSKIARTSFRVTDLHKHNDLYLQLIKRLCETGHGTIHSSLIESWTVFGTSHKLSICTPPAISKTCLRRFRKLMFFVEQDAIDCIEKNLRQKHLMSKWWFPSPHTDSACKMALARKPAQQLTHRCRVAIESPSTKILSGDSLHQLELQIAKKCIEVRLGAIPLAVKISLKAMYSVQKEPLPKQTTVCKSPKFRNSAPIFGEQRILEPTEMNLKKKYLASLWGLPSLYVNSLMEKWLPLPPSAVHVGGINTVSSKEKLFLNEEIRELIELHVRKKRLHQELGLPFKLWKIFNWFTPRPSALSGPKKTKVNRVVLTKKPFFITQKTHLCLDYHIKRVQMQQRDGLPENIIQSLKHFMPSAPEIPESTPQSPIEECKGPLRDPVKGLSETRDATTRALIDAWDPKQHSQSSKQMSSPRETLKESKKTEIIFLQLHLVQKYIEIHLQQFPSRVVKSWNSVQTSEIDELAKTVLSSRISNLPRPTHLTFMEQFAEEQINQNLVHKHLMLMSAIAESSKTLAPQACTWSTTHTRPKRAVMEFVDMQTSFLAGEKRDALKCHVDPERLQYDPTLPFASQRTTVLSPMPAKLTVTKPKFPTEVNIRPVQLTFIEKVTEEKLVSSSRSSLASRACGLSIDKELKPQKLQMSKQESPSRGRGPMFVLAKKRNTNIFKKWTKQRRARAMESKKHNVGTIRQCSVLDTLAIGAKWVDLNMNLENPPSLCGVLSPSTNLFPTTIHNPCSRGPRFNLDGPYIEFSAMETSFLGCKVRTHLDWHVRNKSLQQECSLPQVVQNSLQMFIPPTQHLLRSPYHREAKLKILPLIWKLEFIDEGIKEQLEFHIQRLIVQKRFGLSRHIQDELKQSLLSFPTSDAQTSDDQESVGSFSTRSEASLATKGSIAAEDKPQRFTDAYATTASQFNNQLEQHLPRKCLEGKTGVLPFLAERSLRITSSTMKTSLPKQIIQSPHVKPRATLVPFLEAENVHQVDMNIKHKHYMSFQVLKSLASPSRRHPLTSNEKSDPPFQPQSVFILCSKNVTKIPPPVKHEDSLSPEEDLHHPNLLFGRPALRLTPQKDNPGARCKYQQKMAKHSDSWQVDLSLPKPLAQMSRVQKYQYMTWRHRDRNVSPSAAKANPLLRKTQHTTSTEMEAHSLGSLHQNSPKRDDVSGDNDSLPDINDFQDIAKAIELHLQQKLVQSMLPHLQTPASKSVTFSTFTKSPTSLEETHQKCSTVSDAIVAYFKTPQNILELISIVNFHLRKRNFEIPFNPPCPVHDSPKLEPTHIDHDIDAVLASEVITQHDTPKQNLFVLEQIHNMNQTPINTAKVNKKQIMHDLENKFKRQMLRKAFPWPSQRRQVLTSQFPYHSSQGCGLGYYSSMIDTQGLERSNPALFQSLTPRMAHKKKVNFQNSLEGQDTHWSVRREVGLEAARISSSEGSSLYTASQMASPRAPSFLVPITRTSVFNCSDNIKRTLAAHLQHKIIMNALTLPLCVINSRSIHQELLTHRKREATHQIRPYGARLGLETGITYNSLGLNRLDLVNGNENLLMQLLDTNEKELREEKREILTMRDVSSQTLDAWDRPLGTSTPINTVSGSERNVEQKPCNRIASLFQASHGENSPAMPKQAGKDIPNTSTDASSKMAARRASKSDCIASPVQRKATFLQNLMSKLKKSIFNYGQRKIKPKKGGVEVHGPSRESGLPLKKNTAQNPTSKVRGKEKVTKRTPKIPKANTKTSSKICPVHSTPKPGKPIKTISSPFSIGDTASSGQKTSDRETHKAEDLLEQNFRVDLKDTQDGRKSLKERRKSEHVASTPIAKEDTHSTRHTLYKETSKSTQEWEANWELMSGRTARIKQSSSPEWNVQPSTASTSASCVTVEYGLDSTKTHGVSGEVMSLDVIAPRGRRHRGVETPTIQGNSSTDKSTSLMSYYPVTGKRHADRGPGYSSLSTKSSSSRHKMFCWNINAEDHV